MTIDHLSRETLEALGRSELPPDVLGDVDRHLAECQTCRAKVGGIVTHGAGLLAAVRLERERHLSFDELESLVEGTSSNAIDPLAQQHLDRCESCQRELADLRSFEPLLEPGTDRVASAVAQPAGHAEWRVRHRWFSRPLVWAGAAAAVLVLVAVGPSLLPLGGESTVAPAGIVVRLGPPSDGTGNNSSALRPGTAIPLPVAVIQALGGARRLATETGRAQTIDVRITRGEYQALGDELRSIGTLEDGSLPARVEDGAPDDQMVVSVTLLPARDAIADVPGEPAGR